MRNERRNMHLHRCGFDPSMRPGCGHTWRHENIANPVRYQDFIDEHHCPKCGRGPWGYIYKPVYAPMCLLESEPYLPALVRAVTFARQNLQGESYDPS